MIKVVNIVAILVIELFFVYAAQAVVGAPAIDSALRIPD